MKDIFYIIIIMNFIILPIVTNRNLEYSNELLSPSGEQKTIYLSDKVRRGLLLKSVAKSGLSKVRVLGLFHYILVAYLSILFTSVILLLSLVNIVKLAFGLEFTWFSTAALVLSSFAEMGYSALMVIIFGFLSWILNKKQGL